MKKKLFIVIGLLGLVFVIFNKVHNQQVSESSQSTTNESSVIAERVKSRSSSDLSKQGSKEANATLEKKGDMVSDVEREKVKSALKVAMDYLKTVSSQSDVALTYDNKLSITRTSMAQTIITMLLAGYSYDESSLVVNLSDSDNVYQFTVSLSKSDTDKLTLVGNYVLKTTQIELSSLHGSPTGIAN